MKIESLEAGFFAKVTLNGPDEAIAYTTSGFPLFSIKGINARREALRAHNFHQGNVGILHEAEDLPGIANELAKQASKASAKAQRAAKRSDFGTSQRHDGTARQLGNMAEQVFTFINQGELPLVPPGLEFTIPDTMPNPTQPPQV